MSIFEEVLNMQRIVSMKSYSLVLLLGLFSIHESNAKIEFTASQSTKKNAVTNGIWRGVLGGAVVGGWYALSQTNGENLWKLIAGGAITGGFLGWGCGKMYFDTPGGRLACANKMLDEVEQVELVRRLGIANKSKRDNRELEKNAGLVQSQLHDIIAQYYVQSPDDGQALEDLESIYNQLCNTENKVIEAQRDISSSNEELKNKAVNTRNKIRRDRVWIEASLVALKKTNDKKNRLRNAKIAEKQAKGSFYDAKAREIEKELNL